MMKRSLNISINSQDLETDNRNHYYSLILSIVLLPLLLPLSALLALVEVIFQRSGTVEIVARVKD